MGTQIDDRALHDLLEGEMAERFEGWDFSRLDGRMIEEELPWSYRELVEARLIGVDSLLDLGTGGGEFLASLTPLPAGTCATEGWEPNVDVARRRLEPLGVTVSPIVDDIVPFGDAVFGLVINRHESYKPAEVARVLAPGACFVTQQVGSLNNLDLTMALGGPVPEYLGWCLAEAVERLEATGFEIEVEREFSGRTRFTDIGAVAYYLKCIPWQIKGFSVDRFFPRLKALARRLANEGHVEFTMQRFVIVARKK